MDKVRELLIEFLIITIILFVAAIILRNQGGRVIGINQFMEHPLLEEARKG